MGSQVFCSVPDYLKVMTVLDSVCVKSEKLFVVNKVTYRQLLYNDNIEKFYDYLRPYYHKSKQFYLDIERGYAGFLSVLRQLCKVFSVQFISKIKHIHGSYENKMLIYVDRNNWETQPEPTTSSIKFVR